MLRTLWIAAAGACIALSAGNGVASAESDASDGGTASSSTDSTSGVRSETQPDAQPAANDLSSIPTVAERDDDSADGPTSVDKPESTVSASTVTVRRDDTATIHSVPEVESLSATEDENSTDAEPVVHTQPAVDAEPPASSVGEGPTATVPPAVEPAVVESTVVSEDAPAGPVAAPATSQIRSLAAPAASARPTPGPLATVVISLLNAFGLMPSLPPAPVPVVGIPTQPIPGTSSINGVTGVKVGSSNVAIPVGSATYTGAADWYFPTRADGAVQAQGVMLLQHGFLGSKSWYSALAQDLAQRTNSIVVVPNIPSFGFFTCNGCTLSAVAMQQGVATLFVDPSRAALNASAAAAGYQGVLPEKFVLTGHSAGGGLATAAGGFYAAAVAPSDNDLLGVVMYDGVSSNGTFGGALAALGALSIPVYQIAAPPQPWNANGQTTADLVALKPGQFVGVTLANGSHVDSLIGGVPIIDFVSQLVIKRSPAGNTQAVYTLANGWINDMYAGTGPANPVYGIYGAPNQYLVLGQAAGVVLGPPPVVDLNDYLGTWYEVGSVKQFFSIGLVNTTAVYSLNADGSIRVANSGNYFFDGGPQSRIVGTALPVSATNDKLNVTFFGPPSAAPPGNYWIVDLAPDYSWAVVSDARGRTGFLLSRTRVVSDDLYRELLDRASVDGVNGWITRTRQPAAAAGSNVAVSV
jgi:lipocalin